MKPAIHKWINLGDLLISFSTAGPVPTDVWDEFLKHVNEAPVSKFLGASVGLFEVSSIQRKQLSNIMMKRKIPIAAVTDEKLVRGIVTAASWLGVNVKAFAWVDLRQAIRHLGVARPMEDTAYEKVMELRAVWSKRGAI
jgi:hypothetical protein